MSIKNPINLAGSPLGTTVLTAKRYRLETRWRDCLVVTGVLGLAFVFALWFNLYEPALNSSPLSSTVTVVLALLFACALRVLWVNALTRRDLRPATTSQLELVALAHDLPMVARYLEAVQALGRGLNRAEAAAIANYSAGVPRARVTQERSRGSISRDL